ncbi:hypothetical protein CQ040_18930 [Microbacterium sp. MYb54]|nr:hypothetical protein CQ032_18125 [Microbacterium sp. MYb43]PQZ73442.1 hypothetical protein CQ031_17390 [Microbacterium sp. MYb40]PRB15668.1 hypothetical protein CQ040_18930 [Microbacterium sp. MYb54]PRB22088.1 hypothetical protein CQ037_18645 [Microbacterium sp. MYb50]PRB60565.1 hypothetical protein CQ021_18890 [Microbacterium sp. MYb24]PRB67956.1 hypothetical protein CQ027_17970 [Microbacterium sp. MYb32]
MAFDDAFEILRRDRRSEYVYKNDIISRIVFGRHSPRTASAATEFQIGRSFADVVVFNGTITAYEVKTDFDSFARLETQLADYSMVAERVYVVTSPKRTQTALALAPAHVGVASLAPNGRMSVRREAEPTLDGVTHAGLLRLLRASERTQILADATAEAELSRSDLVKRFERKPIRRVHNEVTEVLRRRFRTEVVEEGGFPASLRALAYGVPLSGPARTRLATRLRAPLDELSVAI